MTKKDILRSACAGLAIIGGATAATAAIVPIEAEVKQMLLEHAFVQTVQSGEVQKPWDGADMHVVGKLHHPRLNESAVVLSAGTIEAMRAGPTLVPGSADIGAPGTSVIAAHRDTHFAFLQHVKKGDILRAAGGDGQMRGYRVSRVQIVHADNFSVATGVKDNRLVLSTCYPFGSMRGGKLRYVVHAERE